MALTKMTVSDSQGNSDKVAAFPYQFYATIDDNNTSVVNILMPLGGKESGLFRFPKSGEQVMVDQDSDNNYYLRGYIPSETDATNNFLANLKGGNGEKEALEAERGIILRYEQTGLKKPPAYNPKDTSELYSEIGFYHRPTQWKAGTDSKSNYNDFDTKNPDIPLIDQINIQSSGDIHTKAVNHNMMKAERIEILAGAPEVLDRKTNAVDDQGTLPLGDFPGDDSALHREDLHIRAGNRIIIKADQEIRLQVGRTVLRIDDTGFNVITRSVAGNYINSYDTMLDMSPRNGINLTGKNINLRAGYRFNAGDGLGGMAATTMGNLNLGGREINIDAYNKTEYMFNLLYQGMEYMVNAASGGMALAKDDIKIADYLNFAQQSLEQLIRLARQVSELFAKRKEIKHEEAAAALGVTGDFREIDIPTDPEVVKANHDAANEQLKDDIASYIGRGVTKNLGNDGVDEFTHDLKRTQLGDITLDGRPVSPCPERAMGLTPSKDKDDIIREDANNDFARFLTGDDTKTYADLTDDEKTQVKILQSMGHQDLEIGTLTAGKRAVFGMKLLDGAFNIPSGLSGRTKTMAYSRDPDTGDFVLDFTISARIESFTNARGEERPFNANSSRQNMSLRIAIPAAELVRLSGLDWSQVPRNNLPGVEFSQFQFNASYINNKNKNMDKEL